MASTIGQELTKYILPALQREVNNNNDNFMSALNAAPKESITSDGINVQKILDNITQIEFGKTGAYTDSDLKRMGLSLLKKMTWKDFTTMPTAITKEDVNRAMFGGVLESERVRIHFEQIKRGIRDVSLYNIAPDNITDAVCTTNNIVKVRKGDQNNPGLLPENIIDLVKGYQKLNVPSLDDLYVVLSPDDIASLLKDSLRSVAKAMQDIYENTAKGVPTSWYGLKFFVNNAFVAYGSNNIKKAMNSALASGDKIASLVFYKPHTLYAVHNMDTHYKSRNEDTRNNPSRDEFRITGDYIGGTFTDMFAGVIV